MRQILRLGAFAGVSVLIAAFVACTAGTGSRGGVRSAPQPAEKIVADDQFGRLLELSVGQRLRIARPSGISEWQVDYDSSLLEMLTPPAHVRAPGPDGWLFRARGAGEGEIVLTSIAAPGGGPAVLRLALQFKTAP